MIPIDRGEIIQLAAKMFQSLNDLELKSTELTPEQCGKFAFITLQTLVDNRQVWTRELIQFLHPNVSHWLAQTPADHDDRQIAAAFIMAFIDQQMSRVCPVPGVIARSTIIVRFIDIPKRRFERIPGRSIQVPSTQTQEQMAKGGLN